MRKQHWTNYSVQKISVTRLPGKDQQSPQMFQPNGEIVTIQYCFTRKILQIGSIFNGAYVSDFWDDINVINSMAIESAGFPTQKPEALLERIINASSDENDLVLDCFVGSGTTATVAEKLMRRWIACDL